MKKLNAKIILALLVIAPVALHAYWVYSAYLVPIGTSVSYNQNYTINLNAIPNQTGMNSLSAQAIYSTTSFNAASFTDGRESTGSVVVASTSGLAGATATNQMTVAATSVILAASATDFITVAATFSVTTAVVNYNGNHLTAGTDWFFTNTTTGTAVSLATALSKFSGLTAIRTASTVNLTAVPAGANGNNRTLSVNTVALTIGGAHFGGGHNNRLAGAIITVNGHQYPQGGAWSVQDTSTGTATSIAAFLNRISGLRANATSSVVYSTATTAGANGNTFSLSSTAPSYLTVTSANYAGGVDNAYVKINGVKLTQGSSWNVGATTSATAKAISDAIVASSSLNTIVVSTWTSSTVSINSLATGSTVNYTLSTNAPSSLTVSGSALTGGLPAAWSSGGSVINIPAHGLSTGLGVLYSTSTSNISVSGLHWGTTYYIGVIDANNIALSSSSALAQAGTYIVLGAPATTGPHTFVLTPQSYGGTAGLAWYGSNDGINYNIIAGSSVTYSAPSSTPASSLWDFGNVNYKYIQLQVTAPTTGGLALAVKVNGK